MKDPDVWYGNEKSLNERKREQSKWGKGGDHSGISSPDYWNNQQYIYDNNVYTPAPPAGTTLPPGQNTPDAPEYFTFDPNPPYTTTPWNTVEYQGYTNCYAYAFNMLVNPLTGKKFPAGGMQPGMLSGQYTFPFQSQKDINEYFRKYLAGNAMSNAALVGLIKADSSAVGLEFLSYDESLQGGYRVALVVSPNSDYHWYRDNGDGTWSHKPGQTPVTNLEVLGSNFAGLVYGDVVTDPVSAGAMAGYTSFVGYFYVRTEM